MSYRVRFPHNLDGPAGDRKVTPNGAVQALTGQTLDDDEIDRARPDLYTPIDGDGDDVRETGGDQVVDLEGRTVDELRDLARDRDIPGRSGMTKAQLIDALRDG